MREEHSAQAYEPRMPEAVAWIKARISPTVLVDNSSSYMSLSVTITITTTIDVVPISALTETSKVVGSATLVSAGVTNLPAAATSTSAAFSLKIPR